MIKLFNQRYFCDVGKQSTTYHLIQFAHHIKYRFLNLKKNNIFLIWLRNQTIKQHQILNNAAAELMALTAKTVGEAHLRTCLYTTDEIADSMRKPQDARRIAYFKGLVSV